MIQVNIFYAYAPLLILLYLGALMFLSLFYVIARFAMPYFAQMKVGKVKLTLGFFFISFTFVYLLLPLFVELSQTKFQAWQLGLAVISSALGTVVGYYFGKSTNASPNEATPPA